MDISFQWAPAGTFVGMLSSMEFGPHGLYFNSPVELELSYKTANLDGFDEKDLRIYYYNEETADAIADIHKKDIEYFGYRFGKK